MKHMRFLMLIFALALVAMSASAEDLVRLNTFPTARSLPFYVGVDKGIFARQGIKLEVEFTGSSKAQREGLASGKFEVVIVSGGDGGTNEFILQKGLNSYADIKGKLLVTDAPNTAYGVQAKKIL